MRNFWIILFILYLFVLAKLIVFKGSFFFQIIPTDETYKKEFLNSTLNSYNFIPFRTISLYLRDNNQRLAPTLFNIFGNILLFIPFGIFLPLIFRAAPVFKVVLWSSVFLSFTFEAYQLFTHTGQCDIDDVILNTTGALIGSLIFNIIYRKKVFQKV